MGLFTRNQAAAARPGMAGQGIIISMRDSGITVNNDPEVEFEVAVQLPDRPAYRVTHRQVVHHLMADQFQVGAGVPVRVDPRDPNSIVIA